MTSRTDKQAARAYQREHPGTSYTRALKAVTDTPAAGPLADGLYLGYTITGFSDPIPLVWRPKIGTDTSGHTPWTLGVYGWREENLDALFDYFYRDGLKGTSTLLIGDHSVFQDREHADLPSGEEVLGWSRGQNLSDLKRRIAQVDAVIVNLYAVNYADPERWLLVEALFDPSGGEEDEDEITVQGEHDLLQAVLESAAPGQVVIFSVLAHIAKEVNEGLGGDIPDWGVSPEVFDDWCDVIIYLNTMSEHEPPQVQRAGFPPVEY